MTKTYVVVRLPAALIEQIRIIATAHERSVPAELRVALGAYVDTQAATLDATHQLGRCTHCGRFGRHSSDAGPEVTR